VLLIQRSKTRIWAASKPTEDMIDIIRYNEGLVYSSTLKMEAARFSKIMVMITKLQGITSQKTAIFILPSRFLN
jgi:hypothetical protein